MFFSLSFCISLDEWEERDIYIEREEEEEREVWGCVFINRWGGGREKERERERESVGEKGKRANEEK